MEDGVVERGSCQIVVTKIFIRNLKLCSVIYFETRSFAKERDHLLAFLITGAGQLLFALLCQFLFEAAFTIAMHHGFIAVLAEIFCNEVFIGIVLAYDYNLAEGLQQDTQKGYYGNNLFQKKR